MGNKLKEGIKMVDLNKLRKKTELADGIIAKDPKLYERMVYEELAVLSEQEDNFGNKEQKRIGASEIGVTCERCLYYSYHKYPAKEPSARLNRLFNRGKLEEARIFAYLKLMGLKPLATDRDNRQFYFEDFDGAFSGHCDGLVEIDGQTVLLEMKTMNEKSYTQTSHDGIERSNSRYYAQVQTYMGYMKLEQALFVVVNKNTDDMYFEVVSFDEDEYKRLVKKAERIITCSNVSDLYREAAMRTYYKCKWCNYYGVCYGK